MSWRCTITNRFAVWNSATDGLDGGKSFKIPRDRSTQLRRASQQLIQEKTVSQGKAAVRSTDMRLNLGQQGKIFVLNKFDGTIRIILP